MGMYKFSKKTHVNALSYMVLSSVIFSFIYYYFGRKHLMYQGDSTIDVTLFDCFYFSVITQSLLGTGEIIATSYITKLFVILQIFVSLFIGFLY